MNGKPFALPYFQLHSHMHFSVSRLTYCRPVTECTQTILLKKEKQGCPSPPRIAARIAAGSALRGRDELHATVSGSFFLSGIAAQVEMSSQSWAQCRDLIFRINSELQQREVIKGKFPKFDWCIAINYI